jgi:S1-C subfamily serine protease
MNKYRLSAPFLFFVLVLLLTSLACGLTPRIISSEGEATPISIQEAVATAMAVELEEVTVAEAHEAEVVVLTQPSAAVPVNGLESNLIWLYEEVNPSVVQIVVRASADAQFLLGSGSGFVYDEQGHIVTNNHVVEGAPYLEVVFADGIRKRATIAGTDVDSDLAVIKVESLPDGVKPVPLGDSSQLQVGQLAVAIGSPFGEAGSMTLGIVSGLGRSMPSQRIIEGTMSSYSLPQVIQTDAPINPGNSGGPLLNLQGEVIGVNSAIRTTTGFNSGVGFAIPVNAVHRIAPALIENGVYVYPFMGVTIQDLSLDEIERLGVQGARVMNIGAGSPAAQAGLISSQNNRTGDIILAIDDTTIRSADDLISHLVFETEVGQTVQLTVLRDGRTMTIPLTLGERP